MASSSPNYYSDKSQARRDFLAELDAVITDNSFEVQQRLNKIQDLVHNPTQRTYRISGSPYLPHIECELSILFREMETYPMSDDEEPEIGDSPGYVVGAIPHYDKDYDDLQNVCDTLNEYYYDQRGGTPTYEVVDGVLYVLHGHRTSMVEWKTVPQWYEWENPSTQNTVEDNQLEVIRQRDNRERRMQRRHEEILRRRGVNLSGPF